MSFSVQKDNSGRIVKKNLNLGTSQTVTTNSSLASSYSVFSTNATSLTLNNVSVTASAEELNKTSNITPGTATSNKPLVLDSSKNISNINTLSCSNIIINGTQLGGNSSQSNQILNNINPGTVANSKAVVLDSSRNITNINSISTNKLSISNANLNIEKDYEGFCNTFTSTSINNSNNWISSCWADTLNLFVAISNTGTSNRVMTSPDGITWTSQTSPADYNWTSICWSRQLSLLVAVASSGIGNRVMTSSDGIIWTLQTTPIDNNWSSVCWAAELSLFVAVANSGTNNKVMTSPNGINWTIRTSSTSNIDNRIMISSTDATSFIVMNDGTIKVWGKNYGNAPITLSNVTNAIQITSGNGFWIALLSNGLLKSWGANTSGQLGINTTTTSSSPVFVRTSSTDASPLKNVAMIDCGLDYCVALLTDGTIKSWGLNTSGQLGDSTTSQRNSPVSVLNINNAIAISAGQSHCLALLSDGTIKAWGSNTSGKLGDNTSVQKNSPVSVLNINNAIAISAGQNHSVALLSDGTIRTWGDNGTGQLGINSTTLSLLPVAVRTSSSDANPLSNVIQIVASYGNTYALLSDGTIKAWGLNGNAQVGDNSTTQRTSPVTVSNITTAVALSIAKSYSMMALLADGTLVSWGANNSGQLGDNTIIQRSIPVTVITSSVDANPLTNFKTITNTNWNAVTWSRNLNLLVSVGNANDLNTVMTSSDGINWINRISAGYSNWKSICWAAEIGMYIAVGNSGTTRLMTSTDGINWIPRISNITNDWSHIVWSNEFRVAMAICNNYSNSKILISSDGINWLPSNTNNRKKLTSICWSNTLRKFCLLSNNDDSYKYLDNWVVSAAPINITNEFRHVTWISQLNLFIGVGGSGSKILTSPDGITWTSRTSPNAGLFNNCVAYSPTLNLLVLVGDGRFSSPYIFTSPDGITWTSRTGPAGVNWTNITWGNGLFVATAQNTNNAATSVMTSPDGITWTARSASASAEWWQTIWVNELSLFICVGSGSSSTGRIMTSPNGINWTARNSPEENNWKGIAWSPSLQLLVAVADNPASNINPIMISSNGIDWVSYPAPITYLWSVIWSSELNMFVAINKDSRSNTTGSYMYSSNGTDWITGLTNINQQFWSITWSGSLNTFIAVSSALNNENIIRSIPGSNDTNIYSFLTTYSNTTLNLSKIIKNIYPNKSVVKYGLKQWYPVSTATENNWNGIIWGKNNFIITGENDSSLVKVLSSNNGINWSNSNIAQSFRGNSLAYSPELDIVICVGNSPNVSFGCIYSSVNDGGSWTPRLNNSNNWKSVCWSQDLMMFVTVAISGNFNRVAISYDGINWSQQETNNNNWNSVCWSSELQLFVAVSSTGTNRVMTSSNGINWITYSAASNLDWNSVCWSTELQLFVAVASSGTGNRIMTSSNGINWTSRVSPEDNNWNCVIWVPELRVFTAIASSGSNRLMYSFNGIDWKGMSLGVNNNWNSICWSPNYGQFIMVSSDGTGNKIYRSKIIILTPSNSLLSSSPNIITNNLISNNGLLSFNLGSNPTTHQLEYHNNALTFAVPYSPFYYNMNLRADSIGFDMNTSNFSINIADHNGSTSGLALNGTLITASANNINMLSNITFGIAGASKILTLDSNKSITNINNISCDTLTITSLFSNFEEGISSSNNLLITNSNKEINNINSLESKIVKIKNTSLIGYDNQLISNIQYATTFTRSSLIANISSLTNGIWAPELGIFVAITGGTSNNYRTAVSSDGYNWSAYNHTNIANDQYPLTSIAWSPKLELFVISSNSTGRSTANFYTTINGITLNIVTVPYLGEWTSVAWSPELEMFAAICKSANLGTSVITSTDGITWTARTAVDGQWNDIRVLNGNFIAISFTSYLVSTDGITWTNYALPTTNSMSWSRMTYSPTLNLYVIVGSTGTISRILTSSDLTNWTTRTTPVLNAWSNVLWLNNLNIFIAISSSASSGNENRIMFSSDGINWFIKSNSNYNFNFSNILWSPSLSRILLLYSAAAVLISNSSLSNKLTEYKNNQYKLTLNKLVEKNTKSIGTKINLVNNWNSRATGYIIENNSRSIYQNIISSKYYINNSGVISTNYPSTFVLNTGQILEETNYLSYPINSTTNTEINNAISIITGTAGLVYNSVFGNIYRFILKSDGTVVGWGNKYYILDSRAESYNPYPTYRFYTPNYLFGTARSNEYFWKNGDTYYYNPPADPIPENLGTQYLMTIPNLSDVKELSSGSYCAFALLNNGTVKHWGKVYNQNIYPPTEVLNLNNVITIASSNQGSHCLALLNNGTIKAWGSNVHGNLGNGSMNSSVLSAVDVLNISSAIEISAGGSHSLALLSNGTVMMWGRYSSNDSAITTPTPIININNAISISSTSVNSYAILSDRSVVYWGVKLGGSGIRSYIPEVVSTITNAQYVFDHNSALLTDGTLLYNGSILTSTIDSLPITNFRNYTQIIPSQIDLKYNWTSICRSDSLGLFVAVASSGTNNRVMTSTNGITWTGRTTPTTISIAPTVYVKYISAGFVHSLALMSDGTVKAWGSNEYGQLGDGTTTSSNTPITISGLTNVIGISVGMWSSYALLSDGTIKAWGYNQNGELGDGTDIDKLTPVSVTGITTAINIASSASHAIALLSDGTVKAWGTNYEGELGDGTNTGSLSPVTVSNLSNVIAIDANGSHNLALLNDGTVKAWGYNEFGQLGNNSTVSSSTIVTVSNLSGVKKIACGSSHHSLALLNDGTIKAWGSNGWGQLGDETYDDKLIPVTISGLSNVKDISAGYNFSLALLNNGTIKSWGDNSYGKLGVNSDDITLVKTNSPLTVNTITTANSISAGLTHALAILENGNIMSWGRNNTGQLGNNSTTDTISPVSVHTSSISSDPLTNAKLIQYTITSNNSNNFTSVCWSAELSLFVAVASSGTGDRVMTSPDGITWTARTSASDNNWTSVIWSKELTLFIAVASSGTGNRVMTSSDGITWTSRISASDNNWTSVCWSPELSLLVAVSNTGIGNRVMTSPDGINWTSRTSAANNNLTSVCWCNNINTFIAVSNSNDSYRRVMTSEDGINWILRYSNNNNNWKQVIWINELNMAVAISDSGEQRIMTSFNGIDWQLRNLSITNSWTSLAWASDLGILCAVSNTDTINQIATTIMTYPTYKTGLIAYPGQLNINNATRRVGLGTTSPSYQLQLSSDSAYKLATSTWIVSSDIRLKKNIQDADLDDCYNKIKSLPLKRYKWKDNIYNSDEVNDRTKIGWIADDVQQIFPNSVKEIEAFGYSDCKSMNSDQIIAALYGCIKKLMSISENKKNTIIELQNKINNYKNIINNLEIVEE